MKISSKGVYGVMAMVDLAVHHNAGPVKIRDIADRQDLPKKYLEQVLLDLKRGGLVASSRGKNGGYALDRDPESINLLEILDILEEHVCLVEPDSDHPDYLRLFWEEQTERLREQLTVPLADLVRRKEAHESEAMYHI